MPAINDILTPDEAIELLRQTCQEYGTQLAFSEANGVTPSTVGAILRGQLLIPPKIANALGLQKIVMYRVVKKPGE